MPLHVGVYRHAAHPPTGAGRLLAAVRAAGGSAIASHRSAARQHDLRNTPRYRPEITLSETRLPLLSGVEIHRTNRLDPLDVTVVDGIPTASVALTLLQLGAVLPGTRVTTMAQDAVIRRLVADVDLVCLLERLGRSGRRGTATLRHVLREVPAGKLESDLERTLHGLLRQSFAEEPVLQHPVRLKDGSMAYLDFAWPRRRLAVEADGRLWHATAADFERDMIRRRALARLGWTHYAFGWADVHQRRATVLAELRALDRAAA